MPSKIKVTLIKSTIGCPPKQRGTVRGLGLRRINSSAIHEATLPILGMVQHVTHLVRVEEIQDEA